MTHLNSTSSFKSLGGRIYPNYEGNTQQPNTRTEMMRSNNISNAPYDSSLQQQKSTQTLSDNKNNQNTNPYDNSSEFSLFSGSSYSSRKTKRDSSDSGSNLTQQFAPLEKKPRLQTQVLLNSGDSLSVGTSLLREEIGNLNLRSMNYEFLPSITSSNGDERQLDDESLNSIPKSIPKLEECYQITSMSDKGLEHRLQNYSNGQNNLNNTEFSSSQNLFNDDNLFRQPEERRSNSNLKVTTSSVLLFKEQVTRAEVEATKRNPNRTEEARLALKLEIFLSFYNTMKPEDVASILATDDSEGTFRALAMKTLLGNLFKKGHLKPLKNGFGFQLQSISGMEALKKIQIIFKLLGAETTVDLIVDEFSEELVSGRSPDQEKILLPITPSKLRGEFYALLLLQFTTRQELVEVVEEILKHSDYLEQDKHGFYSLFEKLMHKRDSNSVLDPKLFFQLLYKQYTEDELEEFLESDLVKKLFLRPLDRRLFPLETELHTAQRMEEALKFCQVFDFAHKAENNFLELSKVYRQINISCSFSDTELHSLIGLHFKAFPFIARLMLSKLKDSTLKMLSLMQIQSEGGDLDFFLENLDPEEAKNLKQKSIEMVTDFNTTLTLSLERRKNQQTHSTQKIETTDGLKEEKTEKNN